MRVYGFSAMTLLLLSGGGALRYISAQRRSSSGVKATVKNLVGAIRLVLEELVKYDKEELDVRTHV